MILEPKKIKCHCFHFSPIYLPWSDGVALTVNKSLKCSTWVQSQKWKNDFSLFPKQTIQHQSKTSLCPNHWCLRSWSWLVLWRPIRYYRTNTHPKKMSFSSQGSGMQKRKSRDTWGNRQIWPWSTKWSRAKANRVLPREHIDYSKYPFPTQEHHQMVNIKMDWLYFCSWRWRRSIQSAKIKTWSLLWLRSWAPYCKIQA